jgi:hypothetical protein
MLRTVPSTTEPSSISAWRRAFAFERLFFGDDAAIDDYVFVGNVELGDANANFLADELLHLGCVARAAARGRQKGADADIDVQAAFDDAGYGADDRGFLLERALKAAPVFGLGVS